MISLMWALGERVLPRVTSAVTLLALAALTSPTLVGTFGWATLSVTALRAVSDQAARQVALDAMQTRQGRVFVRRYQLMAGTLGPALLAGCFWFAAGSATDRTGTFLSLSPMCLIPVAYSLALPSVVSVQLAGHWRSLLTAQLIASVGALALAIPVLVSTRDLWGVSVQAAAAEVLFLVLVVRSRPPIPTLRAHESWRSRQFHVMASYSIVGWTQAQAERVLVGALAGTAVLGQYSLGAALSRSMGDAIAAGAANVVRAQLAALPDPTDPAACRATAERVLLRAMALTAVFACLVVITTEVVVVLFLGPSWDASIAMVAVLVLSTIPANLAWTNATLQVRAGNGARSLAGPIAGLLLSLPIAAAATHSLVFAAWLVLVREFVVVVVGFGTAGRFAPWRSLAHGAVLTTIAGLVTVGLSAL